MCRFHHLRAVGSLTVFVALALTMTNERAWAGSVSFPVSVPPECFSLAQREGVPTMIENRYQAAKARLKLARLSGSDPMVNECRAAVRRAAAAMKRDQMADRERGKLARAAATE
jgi:hypothetical protein